MTHRDQTIAATDERVPITICHCPIYMLLCSLKGNVHISTKARQHT
jgi:hypothetical protein